ncbi:MAG: Glycine-tRNA ligase [Parcubacteria group bacterium GW2011_GWF2_38_76]|nr:MAG: Glycine-tRNA ligase [Parcubacteria group bacterium GW2011_GWF2_38_76]HBM45865.1 glycine--tRNA ligase [Patescibacteria group bacterium]
MTKNNEENTLDKVVSLAKRRGFIFQGSEIYGGLGGTWDYGPLGVALKNNIKNIWWKKFVDDREDMYGVDAAILMNPKVWESSGHVTTFTDPLVECAKCKRRFRADHVEGDKCPECGGKIGDARQFNMMFKTNVGPVEDSSSVTYLRPETAGGIFMNFKNVLDSFHPKLPFGIAQIGKAFRNEITPKDFIFRVREFEQMEIEYFIRPEGWEGVFEEWRKSLVDFIDEMGIDSSKVSELNVKPEDLAHYSKKTIDFEFEFPFGKKELYGLAYRTDHDLKSHMAGSGVDLNYFEEGMGDKFLPHVIEPSLGVDRTVLAILTSAYTEDTMGEGTRVFLKLKPKIAPIKAAVFPLMKNKPELVEKARKIWKDLKAVVPQVMFDDNGNVGKRYRRQDEIGTPFCITVDFDTLEADTVTVRDRDTGTQERIAVKDLNEYVLNRIA